jgi:hypothetical protein
VSATLGQARAAKAALAERLAGHPAVNGVGVAREGDAHVVRVNLREPADDLPSEVDGVAVQVRVVGRIVKRGG